MQWMQLNDGALPDGYVAPDAAADVAPVDVMHIDVVADAPADALDAAAVEDAPIVDGDATLSDSSAVMIDPTIEPPRAIAPLSTSTVSSQRPSLRWSNSAMTDGAIIELSRARSFSTITHTLRVTGGVARPSSGLASGVWFWRLRGAASARMAEGSRSSAVWWFRVRAAAAPGDIDASSGSELDVNGDGFADLAVGAPGANGGRGRVDIYYGSSTGLPAMPSASLSGAAAGDGFGSAVASAGDVNGDGIADLLVGADTAAPGARNGAGIANLFLGSTAGITPTAARVFEGQVAGDRLGSAVSSAGDSNGDGYADVAVGAFSATASGRMSAGEVLVFNGNATGVAATPARTLSGPAAGDLFGWAVSAGDVNADGYADLVVGSPGVDVGASNNAGRVSVFFGSMTGLAATASRTLDGLAAQDGFGRSVSASGDLNGDGYFDIAVGADGADVGGRMNSGAVSIYHGGASGVSMAAARTLGGAAAAESFGWAVSTSSDVNNDGYSDLIVGAYLADPSARTDAGAASLFTGSATGIAAAPTRVVEGAAMFDSFGHAALGAGDLNGDGFGDIAIGAFSADGGGVRDAGSVSIYFGVGSGIPASATRVINGTAVEERLGRALALRSPLQNGRYRCAAGTGRLARPRAMK